MRAAGQRAAFYAASAPLMAGFFSVLPRAAGWWSHPGHMSMFIYLLHPLLITNPYVMRAVFERLSALSGREVNVWSPADDGAVVSAVLPASLAVCALLSTPPVRRLLWPLTQPPLRWMLRRGAVPASRRGAAARGEGGLS